VYSYPPLRCVPLTSEARAALWHYNGPIICNNLPVVAVCGGVVLLMALSVSVSYYFKIRGRVTEKTMIMNAGVCSAVAQIAAVIVVVRGAQASEVELWSFGTVVLVLLVPFDIWSLWSYLKKNKRRREYLALFKTKRKDRDGHITQEEFASLKSSVFRFSFNSFPFKLLDDNRDGKISQQEYAKGYELVEAFREFEAGKCRPLCLLLRAKYLDGQKKQKLNPPSPPPTSVRENANLARVHPIPAELPESTDETCLAHNPADAVVVTESGLRRAVGLEDGIPPSQSPAAPSHHPIVISQAPQTSQASETPKFCASARKISVGTCAVSAEGLRSAVGLQDDTVLANMMKDPEHTIECEILIAGDKDDIDNFYSVKYGTSGDDKDIPDHVKLSFQTGKYHGGDIKKEEYDTGNDGKKLADFHKHEASVLAGLLIWHVLVIRLYTSSSFKLFNTPLRSLLTNDGQTKSQHPLRFTVYYLTEGIKKLRAVEAKRDPVGYNAPMELWRGMADMEVDVEGPLLSQGGTEMAVMSTTCDKEVALKYARSQRPLLFKYKTFGLSRGVSIQFLSFYPKEVEYVYPVPFQTSL
jgi:hypothetical protein